MIYLNEVQVFILITTLPQTLVPCRDNNQIEMINLILGEVMRKLNGLLAVGIAMTLAASCASENADIRSKDYMFENLTDGAPEGLTQDDELKGSEIIAAGGIPDPVFALASPNKTPAGYRYEGVGLRFHN